MVVVQFTPIFFSSLCGIFSCIWLRWLCTCIALVAFPISCYGTPFALKMDLYNESWETV